MQEHSGHFESSPIRKAPPAETRFNVEQSYQQQTLALTRRFVYDDADVRDIERQIAAIKRTPALDHLEKERHELEALTHLMKGITAHEDADLYFSGAWQAALVRQEAGKGKTPKPPETLTREEVAREFDAFTFRDQITDAEQSASTHYQKVLETGIESFQTSVNTKISREDIELLVNDLSLRQAERNPDDASRKEEIAALDQQLRELIERIPEEEWGKRFELEEIYLLRRLIHTADTGHLASVSHGTPREDLNPDRGSVDMRLTAAGDLFKLQIKTYKRGVSFEARRMQLMALDRAHRHLNDPDTHVVVLEAESVQGAFEKAVGSRAQTTRLDKFRALQPVTDVVKETERSRLLTVLGLTKEDFREEQEAFDRKVVERQKQEEELSVKWDEERLREADIEARIAALAEAERQQEEEARLREEERLARMEQDRVQAQAEREAMEQSKELTLAERQARKRADREAVERAAAEREAELQRVAEEQRKKEERRKKREQKERETPDWPPVALSNLGNVTVLKNIGLLHEDWNDDVRLFLEAKKKFVAMFATPRKKNASAMETDKPNPFFAEVFPTRQSLESPTGDDLRRIRALLKNE